MHPELFELIGDLLNTSEYLATVRELKARQGASRLYADEVRPLSPGEIARLEAQGNSASDWNAILVVPAFRADFVRGNSFHGRCVLGLFDGNPVDIGAGISHPDGIYRSTIINSEIGSGSLVADAKLVGNTVVMERATLFNPGSITAADSSSFGNSIGIAVGLETGGRDVLSYAELTVAVASLIAKRKDDSPLQESYRDFVARYAAECRAPFGVIATGAVVINAVKIAGCFVGSNVTVDGAVLLENCTVLGAPGEATTISHGAVVRNSCVQPGCEVTTHAIVESSVLVEHSHVERHGKVTMSVLGPNSGVAEGEVTSCLVGPFVGFHHQALLIAAVWPEGKGNVGYGANVGSNHTSKAPDQEIFPGEGIFFGLGSSIKFPADFTEAPYSIIATAVNTLPQRVEFPFSLINKPTVPLEGISSAFNEIFPGWVLAGNIYTIRRNEAKFMKRNRARRSSFACEVFRPDIVEKMVRARERLRDVREVRDFYTQKDIPGLGKNVMLERSRKTGIEAYAFYIEHYALDSLFRRLVRATAAGEGDMTRVYDESDGDPWWEYARRLLRDEGLVERGIAENMERLIAMKERIALSVQKSKERDDGRGKQIIRDYCRVRVPAMQDSFIRETWDETRRDIEAIRQVISRVG